jgi:hypothetical protein
VTSSESGNDKKIKAKLDISKLESLLNDCASLAIAKNHDYGSANIEIFGAKGCLVRLMDKVQRLKTLLWDNVDSQVKTESIEDTCKDAINYAGYIILLLRDENEQRGRRSNE